MTKLELAQVLAVLSAAYPKWQITEELPKVYYELLGDIDGEIVQRATKQWAMTEKWPPTIAELRSTCAEICGMLAPSPEMAWAEVADAIRTKNCNWSHPAIASAVKTVGWWDICHNENVTATRAQFFKIYGEYQQQGDKKVVLSTGLSSGIAQLFTSERAELATGT